MWLIDEDYWYELDEAVLTDGIVIDELFGYEIDLDDVRTLQLFKKYMQNDKVD